MRELAPEELTGLGREAEPFTLVLEHTASGSTCPYTCLELLRVLPGRRLVVRAESDQGRHVLKLFLGPSRDRHCEREERGLSHLAEAGLPTAQIQDRVRVPGVLSGLVLEYLEAAEPVTEEDQTALEAVAGLLGAMHEHGLTHRDLHLDNFLQTADGYRIVDGDGIRRSTVALGQGLEELAVLAAQRSPRHDPGAPALVHQYLTSRNADGSDDVSFGERLRRARRHRVNRYATKTRRDCTEFAVSRSWRRRTFIVRQAMERLPEGLVEDPGSRFDGEGLLKAGNSATVIRTSGPDPLVVKRFNIKSPAHGARRMLRPLPRYRRAWTFGQVLRFLEIPTARPLALIEERIGPLRGRAYLVLESLEGPGLAEEIESVGLTAARRDEVIDLFRLLATAGLAHGDTKITNFVIHEGRVHLIDLDAMYLLRGPGGVDDRQAADVRQEADVRRFLDNFTGEVQQEFTDAFYRAGLLKE